MAKLSCGAVNFLLVSKRLDWQHQHSHGIHKKEMNGNEIIYTKHSVPISIEPESNNPSSSNIGLAIRATRSWNFFTTRIGTSSSNYYQLPAIPTPLTFWYMVTGYNHDDPLLDGNKIDHLNTGFGSNEPFPWHNIRTFLSRQVLAPGQSVVFDFLWASSSSANGFLPGNYSIEAAIYTQGLAGPTAKILYWTVTPVPETSPLILLFTGLFEIFWYGEKYNDQYLVRPITTGLIVNTKRAFIKNFIIHYIIEACCHYIFSSVSQRAASRAYDRGVYYAAKIICAILRGPMPMVSTIMLIDKCKTSANNSIHIINVFEN